ncbi:MAG: cyclase family protein [Candidatus Paceibacterota bacterium]
MQEKNTIIDISIPLSSNTVVYPGDPQIKVEVFKEWSVTTSKLSEITMGTHSGTHIDSPSHCLESGKRIEDLPLDIFVGPARVLDFSSLAEKITKEDLVNKNVKIGERILAKTRNSKEGFETWRDNFVYLDGEAADYLAFVGIKLFGIDYLSVKQKGSKDNRAHTSLLSKDIPILETIDLSKVEEGEYFLVCAPLKISGVEGARTRAILLC